MADQKISLMPSITPVMSIGKQFIPVIYTLDDGSTFNNGKVDLHSLLNWLKGQFQQYLELSGETPSTGQSGQTEQPVEQTTSSSDITLLSNQVAELRSLVNALYTGSTWPSNYIKIIKNGVGQDYPIPSGPGQTGTTISINDPLAVYPSIYTTTSITNYNVVQETEVSTISFSFTYVISTDVNYGGLAGAKLLDSPIMHVSVITDTGEFNTTISDAAFDFDYPYPDNSGQYFAHNYIPGNRIAISNGIDNLTRTSTTTLTLQNITGTVQSISVRLSITGAAYDGTNTHTSYTKNIPNNATFTPSGSSSGTSITGGGYILFPENGTVTT